MCKATADYHAIALLNFIQQIQLEIVITEHDVLDNGIAIEMRSIKTALPYNAGGTYRLRQYRYRMSCCCSPWMTYNEVIKRAGRLLDTGGVNILKGLRP
jgi:hypothetical protein